MQKFSLSFIIMLSIISFVNAQDLMKKGFLLPSVNIKTAEGKSFNTSSIDNKGKPLIVSFWATWCKPCQKEMTAISESYEDWQKETGVKLVAVSIDDSRTKSNILPLINGKGWEFEFLSDENSDFKRAMNVLSIPHMFILNKNKEVVWQHNSYNEGDEKEIIKILRNLEI